MTLTVAIVDDNVLLRDALEALLYLPLEGIKVVATSSSDDAALAALQSSNYRVALLGISTPRSSLANECSASAVLGSSHLALAVRLMRQSHKPRVVLMNQRPEIKPEALIIAGVSVFLAADADVSELVKALRLAGMGKAYQSPSLASAWSKDSTSATDAGACVDRFATLSARELEVMHCVLADKRPAEIAELLSISPKTVATYRSRFMEKLGVHSDIALLKLAQSVGLSA